MLDGVDEVGRVFVWQDSTCLYCGDTTYGSSLCELCRAAVEELRDLSLRRDH